MKTMSKRRVAGALGVAVVILSIAAANSPAQNPPTDADKATELQVRYADARLRLAKADLELARELNATVEGTIPEVEVARLRTNIAVAKRQLEIAKEYTHGSTMPVQLKAAEAGVAMAEAELKSALEVNTRLPKTFNATRIKKLRIKLELAKLRVEMWKDPNYLPSLVDQMQWQIDRLTEQVIELDERVDSLGAR